MMQTKRVLLLEDDEMLLGAIKDFLETNYYSVVAVPNGAEGVRAVLKEDFDVVICDDLEDPAGRRCDDRRLAGHRLEVDDPQRLVDGRAGEDRGVAEQLDHVAAREHLLEPSAFDRRFLGARRESGDIRGRSSKPKILHDERAPKDDDREGAERDLAERDATRRARQATARIEA